MFTNDADKPTAKSVRMMFIAYVTGPVLFLAVTYFQRRADLPVEPNWNPTLARTMLGLALGACAFALVMRRRVPARPREVSADLYWSTALPKALLAWAPLESAMLASLVVHWFTGSMTSVGVAALGLVLLLTMNPWSLDRN